MWPKRSEPHAARSRGHLINARAEPETRGNLAGLKRRKDHADQANRTPPGPRAKLNEEITSRMVSALGSGSYREQAARYAGIGMTTMYRYLEKGEADEAEDKQSPEREFRERVLGAEADAEIRAVGLIRQAAQGRPESGRVLDDGTVLTTPAQPPTWQAAHGCLSASTRTAGAAGAASTSTPT